MQQELKDIQNHIRTLLDQAFSKRINDLRTSIELANEALQESRRLGDDALIAQSLSKLSLFYMITGAYKHSMELGEESLPLFKKLNDEKGIADVKYNIAGVYYKTDNFHLGLIYLTDCLEIYQRLGDLYNQARTRKSLGTIYEYFGDEKSAILSYERAITAAEQIGDTDIIANVYNPLSGIYLNRGMIRKAQDLIDASIEIKKNSGDLRGLAFAWYGKGKVLAKQQRYDEALLFFDKSMSLHVEMGERLGLSMALHKKGDLYIKMGQYDQAEHALNHGLQVAEEFNTVLIKFKCHYLLYQIHKIKGDPETALKYLEIYLMEKEGVINTQTQKVIESYEAVTKMERLQKEAQMERERAEINKKKERAEQSIKVRQEFLSTMSHEIRTPLNAVITITSLLAEKQDAEENTLLESLKFSANNLLRIINDILDFSKLEVGKVSLDPRNVDMENFLNGIINTYVSTAREKGISLKLSRDPGLRRFYQVDETKLFQILGNLIDNAIKFTEEGSVELQVHLQASGREADELHFRIVDSGIGIPDNFMEAIFDSFSQVHSIQTRKKGGSGLGLAIVKKLIDLHGGNIQATSQESAGSVFYFTIRLRHGSEEHERGIHSVADLAGKKVLLAEDNMINALVCTKLLLNWGMLVDHSQDGAEVLKMASEKQYDFILMDIHMPEMDGYEAAGRIRHEPHGPNLLTPIFALTADVTSKQQQEFGALFDEILLKPIEREKMELAFLSRSVK